MADSITELLLAWGAGSEQALHRLMPLVHGELRRLAHRHMRSERAGHGLQTTALVNEAYLRLVDARRVPWQSRAQFFAIAATAMRRVLVDAARARGRHKRGGGVVHVTLDETMTVRNDSNPDLIALDDALTALAAMDERKCRVIELRYFGGLSVNETAEALGVSPATVLRDWAFAKAWLLRELERRA
ncbi:MAG: sigma-70 family RNA polymerase sigma factor [Gammaproteobacteria bacterium]|jgi:RNA polymerase sigma factor (TIGR02999 family)|nr:sigma-70 family RNA polymerase sigma factor [Gammaproteobacteria bacterium]